MKLWKGFTAAALVIAVAPLIGVTTTGAAEAAEPLVVKAAAATNYNPSCENPDGSYNGGVCKTTFPAYAEDLSDEPKHAIYLEWPGRKTLNGSASLNHAERVALLNTVHNANVATCKSYTPHAYRTDPSRWTRFCDGLAKPVVPYFQVKDVVTSELR